MKKNTIKLFAVFTIIAGFFIVSQNVSAACNNQFSGKEFKNDITFKRNTNSVTFTTQYKYGATGECVGVTVPGSFYDIYFSYTLYGKDNWIDVAIPDSQIKLKGGEWSTITFTPNMNWDPNKIYEIRFVEKNELPDYKGPKKKFFTDVLSMNVTSVDNLKFDPVNKVLTGKIVFETFFKNTSVPAGELVRSLNIINRIYDSTNNLLIDGQTPYTNADNFKYNELEQASWSKDFDDYLKPNTTYKLVLFDTIRNVVSKAFNFTTPVLPAVSGTTSGATSGTNSGASSSTYTLTLGEPKFTRAINDKTGTAEFEVPMLYKITPTTNKTQVKEVLQGLIYNKNENKKTESTLTLDDSVMYNTQSSSIYAWNELVKGNEYVFYFYDKKTGVKSPYVSLVYKTDGTFTTNKITSLPTWTNSTTSSGNGSLNTNNSSTGSTSVSGTGTQQTSSETSINGITTTFTATPVYITKYSDGMDAIKVNGFVKYTNPRKTISLATAQAGTILVNLLDKNGNVKYVDEIDLGNYDTVYDKDIPLDSTILAVGNSLDPVVNPLPIFKPSDAPFTIKIIETKLDVRSNAFSVAMPSTNNNTTTTNTTESVQSDEKTGTDGTVIKFNVNASDLVFKTDSKGLKTASAVVNGHLIYNKTVDNDAKVNNIQVKIYNADNRTVSTGYLELDAVTSTDIEFSGTFTGLNPDEAPFMFDISDKDSNITSGKFYIDQSQTVVGFNQSAAWSNSNTKTISTTDGTDVVFTIDPVTIKTSGNSTINGSITFKKSKSDAREVYPGDTRSLLTDKDGVKVFDESTSYVTGAYIFDQVYTFAHSLDLKKDKAPYNLKISQETPSVSAEFQITDNGVIQTSDDPVKDPTDPAKDTKQSTYGLLRNPLRSGLDSIPDIVAALVKNIVIPIAVPFLALSIIYTGFLFIQARGNAEKLKKAKEALKWTLIGGAVILASYVIATALQGTIADIIR